MNATRRSAEATRRAILDAFAHVIVESKELGFSVQQVADRAGVTHRTVYNHFPTRDALSEGLATYVEERLSELGPAPDAQISLETFPAIVAETYRGLEGQEVLARAYVMLMIANRAPAKVARARLRRFEAVVGSEAALPAELTARHVAAAIRMFVSSLGWHVLTEHIGLSPKDAAATATWATRTLVDAVNAKPSARKRSKGESRAGKPTRE